MELRAVLFDLWGTLIVDPEVNSRPRQLWRATNVRDILARNGVALSLETADSALVAGGAALSALHDDGLDVTDDGRVDLFLSQLAAIPPLRAEARRELVEAICSMHPVHRPALGEGAAEVLREIKAMGLPTALVSNAGYTTAPHLREMLDRYGIAGYLDVCVFSDELELAKPHPKIFQTALDGLGVDAPSAAFVGDSPHNDIYGARQAGLFAVQIGHRDAPPRTGYTESDGARPHAHITSLRQLIPALLEFAAPAPAAPAEA
jgi:putative hydrolase of the HAD superfamily